MTAAARPEAAAEGEDLGRFRRRAREWIRASLPPADARPPAWGHGGLSEAEELADVEEDRRLQRLLFEAGFAGLCVPRRYGGQGLTPEHQRAFNEELRGHDYPRRLQSPTFSPCAPVLLEFGTEEQKRRHLPAMLRGEEIWMQFLSEPGGGSDVAGALTTAVRDGDQWVLNGSKIWTTGAWWSDWALCLARTNWDVPKHRGLTVFALPIRQPGIEVRRIEMLSGSKEFCQEFLTDVVVPDGDRVGAVDDGWTVGVRWMFHERMLLHSPFVTMPAGTTGEVLTSSATDVAKVAAHAGDMRALDLLGEARMLQLVRTALAQRVSEAIAAGTLSDQAAAMTRLFAGTSSSRLQGIAFELAGEAAAAWADDEVAVGEAAMGFLMRQASSIAGGTVEMARNVISERVLGMPRERAADRDVPFRDVPRGRGAGS
ncbi:MAG TPA: acyl-CoA dehydrogenase family protein [Acidimicrobiales bacterium]|nr:acyl-CoA dehydrogenase family protein [Acidimicrobiales bacterium]